MSRVLSSELKNEIGKKIELKGRVYSKRELSDDLVFINLQDRGGLVQVVFEGDFAKDIKVKVGSIVKIEGVVKEEQRALIGVEVKGEFLDVLESTKEDLPFDMSKKTLKVDLVTLLDNRPLTIRHETVRSIFNIYDTVIGAYSEKMREFDCREIKTPKILGVASEGGANFFSLDYFDKKAFMAQSPQFYKQMCVGAFERVFEVGSAFRAERSFTTRHVNEYVSLDAEFGFIDDFSDLMFFLEESIKHVFKKIEEKNKEDLKIHNAKLPKIPKNFPKIKLSDIKKIIKDRYGYDIPKDTDIDPQGEVYAWQYAKEEFDSDFIFLTHYPKDQRPFYTMPSKDNEETESFDLIFKGVEISTGGQRIHNYDQLVESIKDFGLNPGDFSFYLETFKYAMPKHGGWGMGSERIVFKLLELSSVKEAILFPRDVKRLHP